MPPGGRCHLCLSFPVCPNTCAAMHCAQQHVTSILLSDSPSGLGEFPQETSVTSFPEVPKRLWAQQLVPLLVNFPEFSPNSQEILLTPRRLADPWNVLVP